MNNGYDWRPEQARKSLNRILPEVETMFSDDLKQRVQEWRFFHEMVTLINLRKTLPALQNGGMEVINTGNPHLFGYIRTFNHQRLLIVNNFSEQQQLMDVEHLRISGVTRDVFNFLKEENLSLCNDMLLHDHQPVWLDISGP